MIDNFNSLKKWLLILKRNFEFLLRDTHKRLHGWVFGNFPENPFKLTAVGPGHRIVEYEGGARPGLCFPRDVTPVTANGTNACRASDQKSTKHALK